MGKREQWLSQIRGWACILVILFHYFDVYFYNPTATAGLGYFPEKIHENIPILAVAIRKLGLLGIKPNIIGVCLFFIISGYLFPNAIHRHGKIRFVTGRLWRLYPLYAIALAIVMIFQLISAFCYGLPIDGSHGTQISIMSYIKQASLLRDWLWGSTSTGVVWTIEYQLKFYVIAVLYIWFERGEIRAGSISKYAMAMGIFGLIAFVINPPLESMNHYLYRIFLIMGMAMPYICLMFLGIVLYSIKNKCWGKTESLVAFAIVYLTMVVNFYFYCNYNILSYSIGIIVFVIFMYLPIPKFRIIDCLSEISFPLYLVHVVIGFGLLNLLENLKVNIYISIVIALVVSIVFASLLHFFVEKPLGERKHL